VNATPPSEPSGVPIGLVLGGGSLLHQLGRELESAAERLLAPLDLTVQQAALLLHASREPSSPSRLRAQLGTDTAGMTRLLDRLEGKGLLRRAPHPRDRRSIIIELTEQGRAVAPRLPAIFGRVSNRVFAGFSADEVAQVSGFLQRMRDNLAPD
jgi:DNA-binding MarR family transcriptional regulator